MHDTLPAGTLAEAHKFDCEKKKNEETKKKRENHRLSPVSVVFDFNASLNDALPFFPMLSVDLMRMEE